MPTLNKISGGNTEWYENKVYYGYVIHPAGYRIAHAKMMKRWAEKMGDSEYVKKMDSFIEAGAEAIEKYLWTGSYYRTFNEPESQRKLDTLFTIQLDGQYFARSHGLDGVFPKDRVEKVLDIIRKKGCKITKFGIPPGYIDPNGTIAAGVDGYGNYSFMTPFVYFQAMNYMYAGQKDFGLELLRRCVQLSNDWGYPWEAVDIILGDTGKVTYGADYGFNMAIWAVPAALQNESLSAASKPGGLVYRMIKAAEAE